MATTMTADKAAQANVPEPVRTGLVPLARIQRDPRVNTRDVDEAWVTAREDKFNPAALGVLAMSHRSGNDTYIVVDGQNRAELCRRVGYGPEVMCNIYSGLDLAQEAGLFVLLNDSRALRPGARFLARITQGDLVAIAIEKTANQAGWEIAATTRRGALTAVATLETLWKKDRRHWVEEAPFVLASTLTTITRAWGHTDKASDAAIIAGIGNVYVKNGPGVSPDVMAAQLAGYVGGPAKLLFNARGQASFGGRVANSVAEIVTGEYNRGKPPRRLPKYR